MAGMHRALSPRVPWMVCAVLAFCTLGVAGGGPAKIQPAWEVTSDYDVVFSPGFESVAYRHVFPVGDGQADVQFSYLEDGTLAVGGVATHSGNISFLTLRGTFSVDEGGVQRIHIEEPVKRPRFRFDGEFVPATRHIVGTYERTDGFLGLTGTDSGSLTFTRADIGFPQTTFRLRFNSVQEASGAIKGQVLDPDAKVKQRATATLNVYGGRVLTEGQIKGRTKTKRDGTTTTKLKVKGRKWSAVLVGPVDADEFHASADVRAAGFVLQDRPVVLPVTEGPPPPPPPPPPAPKNFQGGATASLTTGAFTLQHAGVRSRFFGKKAAVTVRFPISDGETRVLADPTTFTGSPLRQVIVEVGGKVYSTQNQGAAVEVDIREINTIPGGTIQVLLTGTVVSSAGKSKTVDLLLDGTLR